MTRSLKTALRAGEPTIGSWITLNHPAIAEIMAAAGFDWLAIDLEHSVIDHGAAEALIRTVALANVTPLVRLTSHDRDQIKRMLDAGAGGVIAPAVNSAAQARAVAEAVYYPPRGARGVGLARAQGYGARFQDYRAWLEQDAVVIAMIEHVDGVKAARAILSDPDIDGYMIGPYDLSASLGAPGEIDRPECQAAIAEIKAAGRETGKPGGIHVVEPDVERLAAARADGFAFLAYSLDVRVLDSVFRRDLAQIRSRL